MKTISEQEFLQRFLIISEKLTYAEIRMLYILITEPDYIDLPQQIFARRIKTHRRTINIGLKKLRKLKYIIDINPEVDVSRQVNADDVILKYNKETAEKVIISAFKDYHKGLKEIVVQEDFYSFILKDMKLPVEFSNDKDLVTKTIRDTFPNAKLYFDLDISSYKDENQFFIIRMINSEIIRRRNNRYYGINLKPLLQKIRDNFSVEKEEVFSIITSVFPKVRITEKTIRIRKPYKVKEKSKIIP